MKCDCNMCNIDFDSDNGYEYVLDELKTTRDRIDNIIKIIERRMEKDAIINEVLNTEYEDECEEECDKKEDETALDAIIKAIAIRNALEPFNTTRISHPYNPYWSILPYKKYY